jgi:transposase
LRPIRKLVDEALLELSAAFSKLYAREGRPSIPPERLLRALLLQAFYTVRSERMLMEQLEYNLLFRWFVGLSMDDVVWGHRRVRSSAIERRRASRGAREYGEQARQSAKAARRCPRSRERRVVHFLAPRNRVK